MVQCFFFEAQDLIDDVARIAAGEALEEQCMVPHADREAGTAVGMGGTTAHRTARLPDAPQTLHDIGPDSLEFRIIFAYGTSHGRVPENGLPAGGLIGREERQMGRDGQALDGGPADHPTNFRPLPSIALAAMVRLV